MNWETFYGREIPVSEISHQHLSNILWYYQLLVGYEPTLDIQNEINARFGGIRLPYKPMHSFTQEVDALLQKGYITNNMDSDIIVNNVWVGRLKYE